MDWPSAVALMGSLLALVGVAVAAALASAAQKRHWRFTEQIEACADFLSAYSTVYVSAMRAPSIPAWPRRPLRQPSLLIGHPSTAPSTSLTSWETAKSCMRLTTWTVSCGRLD